MKPSSKSLHNRIIRHLREWHRKLGIMAAFFLIFLSLSGIALNHTDALSLAHSPIRSSVLLDHYGISPPNDVRFFGNNNLVVTNELVWLANQVLLESAAKIIAITPLTFNEQQLLAVVSTEQLLFYSESGELVDQLGEESGFPLGATDVGIIDGQLIIKSGAETLQYNSEQYSWQESHSSKKVKWVAANTASERDIEGAKLNYRAQYLTVERIILDAHSGRILGTFGVLFMDVIAILLILLSVSGMYIWLRYARSKR